MWQAHHHIQLSAAFHSDLLWWATFLEAWNGHDADPHPGTAAHHIWMDASGHFLCGVADPASSSWLQLEWSHSPSQGALQLQEKSILLQELLHLVGATLTEFLHGGTLRQHGGSCHCEIELQQDASDHALAAVPALHSATLQLISMGRACPGGGEWVGGCHITQPAIWLICTGTQSHWQAPAHSTQFAGPACGTTAWLDLHNLDTAVRALVSTGLVASTWSVHRTGSQWFLHVLSFANGNSLTRKRFVAAVQSALETTGYSSPFTRATASTSGQLLQQFSAGSRMPSSRPWAGDRALPTPSTSGPSLTLCVP